MIMEKIDILGRESFVEHLMKLMNNISETKSSTCFAINGAWGCGKSFVLDLFEQQLNQFHSEENMSGKYFVIRYNCWEFDYYDEPVIAIVASIISGIEEKTKLMPNTKENCEIIGMLRATGKALLSMANTILKEKTGLDIQSAYETVKAGEQDGTAQYEKLNEYDDFFAFKKALENLTETLQKLAERYTIVLLVDELDRCIPEYAIKVLERLHHLTENIRNSITVVAIDKKQLMFSIHQLFGFEDPAKYLEKFFHFEIKLNLGTISEQVREKFSEFYGCFDMQLFPFKDSVEECIQVIFKNIDIRTQEQIIKKALIVHKLLFHEKKDFSFMCMELLCAVIICRHSDQFDLGQLVHYGGSQVNGQSVGKMFQMRNLNTFSFSSFFEEKVKKIELVSERNFPGDPPIFRLPPEENLYGAIALTWFNIHQPNRNFILMGDTAGVYAKISANQADIERFVDSISLLM